MWPEGSGSNSNVGSRVINSDGSVAAEVEVFLNTDGPDCENAYDVNVTYSAKDELNAFWVCEPLKAFDDATGTFYFTNSVAWLKLPVGTPISTVGFMPTASPSGLGVNYPISGVVAAAPYGGLPAIAWIHDLDGGGQRIETWRLLSSGNGQGWANTKTEGTTVESPAIAVNASSAAIAGGVVPGAVPGQSTASFTRFSPSFYGPVTLSGSFVYSDDPGFVVADDGKSLAAFTAIDGSSIGTARIMVYSDPGLRLNPDDFNYGNVNIGTKRSVTITIGSSGETTNTVSGITLSGANADRYSLVGDSSCIRAMLPNTNCTFRVEFSPQSTASQTAQIAVTSDGGNDVVNLTGRGLNQTRNRITASPGHRSARKGKVVRFKVKAANVGGVNSNNTRVCVNLRKRALKLAGNRCRNLGAIAAGGSRTLNYRIRVTWRVQRGTKLPVTFVMRANNAVVRQAVVNVRRKGR
jgi:hypothetical protein